jgi:hypothetical protein
MTITASKHSGHPDRAQLWIFFEGDGSIGNVPFRAGEVWLVPAGTLPFDLRSEFARALRVDVPALR